MLISIGQSGRFVIRAWSYFVYDIDTLEECKNTLEERKYEERNLLRFLLYQAKKHQQNRETIVEILPNWKRIKVIHLSSEILSKLYKAFPNQIEEILLNSNRTQLGNITLRLLPVQGFDKLN